MPNTYSELLKHPQWQRKRLEILEREDFTCEDFGATEKTLHVHHAYYEKGLKPWEYPSESLHVLCVDCHAVAGDRMADLQRTIGLLSFSSQIRLLSYALALLLEADMDSVVTVSSYEGAEGIADLFRMSPERVISLCNEGVIDGHCLAGAKKVLDRDEE